MRISAHAAARTGVLVGLFEKFAWSQCRPVSRSLERRENGRAAAKLILPSIPSMKKSRTGAGYEQA